MTSDKTLTLAITIGEQCDCLRFAYGWNYDRVARYMMKKFDIDLATLDELLRMSEENDLVREITPAFAAQYIKLLPTPFIPAVDAILMMECSLLSCILLIASFVQNKVALRLMLMIVSNNSSVILSTLL